MILFSDGSESQTIGHCMYGLPGVQVVSDVWVWADSVRIGTTLLPEQVVRNWL